MRPLVLYNRMLSRLEPDDDGIVRRVALAVSHDGTIIPSFALEVLRVASRERSVIIDTGAFGIEDIRIGGVMIPTDGSGRAILHFAPRLARYISAADVLDQAFDPAELQSRIVKRLFNCFGRCAGH